MLTMVLLAFGSVGTDKTSRTDSPEGKSASPENKPKKQEKQPPNEDEIDEDGLVLLRNSVSAKVTDLGIEITGTVVNRRSRSVSYAQISFNVYDDSEAQVGSAFANITNLESEGRWNFKAVSFTKGKKYKFAKLTGR